MAELFPGSLTESVKGRLLFALPKKGLFGVGDKQRTTQRADDGRHIDTVLYRKAV